MRRSKKQRREKIYEVRNSEERITQNKQHVTKCTAAAVTDEIKWKWWWTEKMMKIRTTTIIITTTTTAAAAAAAN